jgi:uncharacterized membrane protein
MSVERGAAARGSLTTAGLVLGIGFGALIEGIVLCHILQWHHMVSSRVIPETLAAMNCNIMWDGIFNLLAWGMIVAGIALLFRAVRRGAVMSVCVLLGAMITGWGMFVVVEGLIAHQLFGVHHCRTGLDEAAWDLACLTFGLAMMVIGTIIARRRHEGSRA